MTDFPGSVGALSEAGVEQALAPHHPYLRGAPPGLPFDWAEETLKRGLNSTLTTDLGPIDLLGEIAGGGAYDDLLPAPWSCDSSAIHAGAWTRSG
jgi:hypothetical protein